MSTQVNVNPVTETEVQPVDANQAKADALLKNEAIVADKTFIKLLTLIDAAERTQGTKWYGLIKHVKIMLDKHERDEAMDIVLKSLLSAGKTYSSAQSIRSYIMKMAKEENAELLEKLNAGTVTVQESRAFGRKAQINPAKTNDDKFSEAVADAVRFGIACQLNLEAILAKVTEKYQKIAKD